jgi:F420-non-reducing hydrogenase iron-sulfur subunit
MQRELFEPKIIGFFCNWCSYRAADGAGTARIKHSPNVRIVRLMCSGRVDPTFVLKALALGADGVLIAGCHPGECHYIEQNYKTIRRFTLLQHTLRQLGISERRVQLVWASAGEAAHLAEAVNEMVEDVRTLGPLHWTANLAEESGHLDAVAKILLEHQQAMEVAR